MLCEHTASEKVAHLPSNTFITSPNIARNSAQFLGQVVMPLKLSQPPFTGRNLTMKIAEKYVKSDQSQQ